MARTVTTLVHTALYRPARRAKGVLPIPGWASKCAEPFRDYPGACTMPGVEYTGETKKTQRRSNDDGVLGASLLLLTPSSKGSTRSKA